MRRCGACSYLSLGDGDTCKHCGAPLDAVASPAPAAAAPQPRALVTVGATAAAPGPAPTVIPPPPPPPLPPFRPASSVRFDDDFVRSSPAAPPRRRTSSRRSVVFVARLLVLVVCGIAGRAVVERFLADDGLPAGTSEYVDGKGVQYVSPDGMFVAAFPQAPSIQPQPIDFGSLHTTLQLAQVQRDDFELVAASMRLPVVPPAAQLDRALLDMLRSAAANQGAKIVDEQRVTHDGASGIAIRATAPDGYDAQFAAFASGSTVYMLGAHATAGTDHLYDTLLRSFRITAPASA